MILEPNNCENNCAHVHSYFVKYLSDEFTMLETAQ